MTLGQRMNGAVVVLGDVGRSPRMQFHCLSLQARDWVESITIIGFKGTPCLDELETSPKVRMNLLESCESAVLGKRNGLALALLKAVRQSVSLLVQLLRVEKLDFVLVQNPPCIPTFAVLLLVKLVRGTNILIDWHNLGFSIMQLSLRKEHWIVKIGRLYEKWLGHVLGDAHLTVTIALKTWLIDEFGLEGESITVQYDKAPEMFRRRSLEEQHDFFERIDLNLDEEGKSTQSRKRRGNRFTRRNPRTGEIESLPDRPALVVSSTSWTPDEDFGLLFNALVAFDKVPTAGKRREVVCVVTGKGPQKVMYEAKIDELALKNVQIKTLWLEADDYPVLLGCADLGVCLHLSSSDLDLPMKVVDMFGSGLPVCAVQYPCLNELVVDEENGLVFRTEQELAVQLQRLLLDPGCEAELTKLSTGVKSFSNVRWETHWEERTAPVLKGWRGQRKNGIVSFCFFIVAFVFIMEAAFLFVFQTSNSS